MGARGAVATVVVLGVLGGGAVVADRVLHGQAETRFAREIEAAVPGLEGTPDVTIGGVPFLTQLAAGELQDVRVEAPGAVLDGLRLEDVDVHLQGVATEPPITAETATMTAFASVEALQETVDVPFELLVDDTLLVARRELLGLPIDVVLVPRAAGRSVEVDVEAFRLAGATISADDLPAALVDQVQGLTVPVEGLPAGMELTGVTVVPGGVTLVATGTAVVLDPAALG